MLARAVVAKESPSKKTTQASASPKPSNYLSPVDEMESDLGKPNYSWSLANISIHPPERRSQVDAKIERPWLPLPLPIQAKLEVGAVDDPLEREADRVAEQVMRTPDPAAASSQATLQMLARGQGGNGAPAAPAAGAPAARPRAVAGAGGVTLNVLDWDATRLAARPLANAPDNRLIAVPQDPQIQISALVEVNGGAGAPCNRYKIGTTQTAWIAWTHAYYEGQNPGEGSIRVRYRPSMPMRDPGTGGDIWYNPNGVRNVISPAACGDSVGIFHLDGPWHHIPKARNNGAVAGRPLNYLRSYTRGLHLVTYLTATDDSGNFLPRPLRFRYWNSIQDFQFTPNYATPRNMWTYTGGITVNIGSKGTGETADAPYFTTAGPHLNDHFNDPANWDLNESR